jgi:hypothetical protein
MKDRLSGTETSAPVSVDDAIHLAVDPVSKSIWSERHQVLRSAGRRVRFTTVI